MAKSSGFSAGQKALQAMGVATAPSSPITQQKSNTSGQTPGQNALKAAGISGYQQPSTPQTGYGSSPTSREDEIYKALTAGMQQNQGASAEPSFVDWAGRQDLVNKYNQLQESTGFATTVEQSNELEAQMKAIREQIDAGDIKFGNGLQSFGAADRAKNVFEGATNQYLGGLVNNAAMLVQHQGDTVDYAMRNGEFADWLNENGYELSENSLQGGETIRQAARDYLEPAADYLKDTGAQNIEAAKGGLGTVGQAAVDLATNAIQMGYDVGLGALLLGTGAGASKEAIKAATPAARKAAMFIRTLGSAGQEARRDENSNATNNQQLAYGITKGSIEVATEMMFDGIAGIMGKGGADVVVEKVVSKLAKSNFGRTVLRGLIETGGEGFEEVVSEFLDPYAKMIYNGKGLKETFKEGYDVSELLYSFIIGAAMGGFGQVGSITTGQHAAKNLALELQDAQAAAFNQRYGIDEAMDALMGTSRNGQSGFNGRWGLQNNTQAAAQQNPAATSVTGLIKNAPDPNNNSQKYVATQLEALDEATAKNIASDERYVSAFEDLTDLPLSGTPEQIAQQILDYAQEATGAQETPEGESVPPAPAEAGTEPPAALNSNQSETARPEAAEQATNPATEALLNPVVPGQEEARSQLPPKPLRSGADMALWALGLDQQNQQDAREAEGVDIDAADFDDSEAEADDITARSFMVPGLSEEAQRYFAREEQRVKENASKKQAEPQAASEEELERSRNLYGKESSESGEDAYDRRERERRRGEATARVNRWKFSDEDFDVEARNRSKGNYYELRITARAQIEDDYRNISRIMDGKDEWSTVSARYRANLLNDILETDKYYTRGKEVVAGGNGSSAEYDSYAEDKSWTRPDTDPNGRNYSKLESQYDRDVRATQKSNIDYKHTDADVPPPSATDRRVTAEQKKAYQDDLKERERKERLKLGYPKKAAREVTDQLYGLDIQRQQDILDNQKAVDISAEDFDDGSPYALGGANNEGILDNGRATQEGKGRNKQDDAGRARQSLLEHPEIGLEGLGEKKKRQYTQSQRDSHQRARVRLERLGFNVFERGSEPANIRSLIDLSRNIIPDADVTFFSSEGTASLALTLEQQKVLNLGPVFQLEKGGRSVGIFVDVAKIESAAKRAGTTVEAAFLHDVSHYYINELGVKPLDVVEHIMAKSDDPKSAKAALELAFYRAAENHPEILSNKGASDEQLVSDFWNEVVSDLFGGVDRYFRADGGDVNPLFYEAVTQTRRYFADFEAPLNATHPASDNVVARSFANMANALANSVGSDNKSSGQPLVEKLVASLDSMRNTEPLATISGNELPTGGRASDRMMRYISKFGGKVNRPGFGEVLFSRSKINSSVMHGVSDAKIQSFAAVPAIIENGTQIDWQENWEEKGYDSYIFAGPILQDGERRYVGVIVHKDTQSNRYYVHEVVDEEGGLIYKSEAPVSGQDGPATQKSTLDTISDNGASDNIVARSFESSKPSDGDEALNARDQEIDELEKRDKRREEDEFQEKRWGDKHTMENAKGWAAQERANAKAESEANPFPKHDVARQFGEENRRDIQRAVRNLAKNTSKPIDGNEAKREFDSATYGKAQKLIEAVSEFANGNMSLRELADVYSAMKGKGETSDNAFYEKSIDDTLRDLADALDEEEKRWQHWSEDGRFVDNTGKNQGEYKPETAKAVAEAIKDLNYRLQYIGRTGVTPRADLTNEVTSNKGKQKTGTAKTVADISKKFTGMQLRPDTMFKLWGGFRKGSKLYQFSEKHYKAIRDKQNAHRAAVEYFITATQMKGYKDFASGKTAIDNPIPGHSDSKLSLNTALSLLKTLETNGAIEHIIKNGAQFAISESEYYKGRNNNGFGDTPDYGQTLSLLSDKTLDRLENAKEGKDIAHARSAAHLELEALRDALKAEVMKNEVAKALYEATPKCMSYLGRNINSASRTMYGKDFATEGKSYYPLEIAGKGNKNELLNDPRSGLKNWSRVKERTGDSGALRIRAFTDVMSGYIDQATDWAAFSVLSDELELLSRNNGKQSGLKAVVGSNFGRYYSDWLENYVADLNGTRKAEGVQFTGLRSNLASAALTLNGGVALKQSPSYWDAAGVIDMGILVKHSPGLFKTAKSFESNPLIQEVEMRTGMLGERKLGLGVVEVGEATENARSLSNKVNGLLPNWMTNWISKTDVRTTSNLMLACADQVLADDPNLKAGTENYYKAVADKFEEVILKTQPVYTKQARADYMRVQNDVIRTLAMFRTQQTQNFNQLVTAVGEYRNAYGKDKVAAAKQLRQVAAGQVVGSTMFAILSAVAKAGLHKWDDFEDEEGNFDAGKTAKRVGLNFLGSVAATVWFGDKTSAAVIDALTGGKTSEFSGLEDNVLSMVSDAVTSGISFAKNRDLKSASSLVFNLSQALGIPTRNAYNLFNSVAMFGLDGDRALTGGSVMNDGKTNDLIRMISNYNKQTDKQRARATFDAAMRASAKGNDEKAETLMATLDYNNEDVVGAIKAAAKERFALGEIDMATYQKILTKWGQMSASDAKAYAEGQEEKRELAELMENDAVAQLDQQISDAKDRADEYDSSRDYAAMDLIIGALLDDADTDKLVRAKTSKGFRTSYEAMRQAGMTPKEVSTTYKAMDGDNNGSLKQDELVEYYLANPGMEYIIKQIWATKGWKTSWETKRDKAK